MVAHTPPRNAYELQVQSCKATTVPGSPWLLKPEGTLHSVLLVSFTMKMQRPRGNKDFDSRTQLILVTIQTWIGVL